MRRRLHWLFEGTLPRNLRLEIESRKDSRVCGAKLGWLRPLNVLHRKGQHQLGTRRGYLQKLIATFRDYPLAIEVRHSGWNDPNLLREFAGLGVSFVNIDQPLLGRAMRATAHVTGSVGYVRLHGRNYQQWFAAQRVEDRYNFLYTPDQLEPWKERIEEIAEQAETTFVVANNHYLGKAAANAAELKSMLSGKRVKAPPDLIRTYPELAGYTIS